MNLDQRYALLSDFRTLVRAVEQCNKNIQNNSRLVQDLKQQIEQIKKDSRTISGVVRNNAEQCKKFDKKINFDLDQRVRQLERVVKELARTIQSKKY